MNLENMLREASKDDDILYDFIYISVQSGEVFSDRKVD